MVAPSAVRALQRGRVDLHWADLNDQRWDASFASLSGSLTSDEISRAAQFKHQPSARNYALCRALLRKLLEQYTGIAASALVFSYTSSGKPYLGARQPPIQFNLSHSAESVVFAFSWHEVGVDIERLDAGQNAGEAAAVFLSEAELRKLADLSPREREAFCLRVWTRKEALLKGIGTGLVDEVRQIEVGARSSPMVLTLPAVITQERDWILYDVGRGAEIIGAVAVPGTDTDAFVLHAFQMQPGDAPLSI